MGKQLPTSRATKAFRGFWSRNYTHCMRTRKEYLQNVGTIATRTTGYLKKYGDAQQGQHEKLEEQKRKDAFNDLAKDLHHLCSTQTIPGVYNPPYSEAVPTAFNVPIEQHLRLQSSAQIPTSLRRPNLNRSVPSNFRPVDPLECGLTKQTEVVTMLPNKRKPLLTRTANVGRGSRVQGPFRSVEETSLMVEHCCSFVAPGMRWGHSALFRLAMEVVQSVGE